ncbi:hypothetical protein ABKN59_004212 [Abortiporus biennis]
MDIHHDCPHSSLHAISAMGTKLRFYSKEQNSVIQPRYTEPLRDEMDTVPIGDWDCDILEEEGFQRFTTIVEQIKKGCAALNPCPGS